MTVNDYQHSAIKTVNPSLDSISLLQDGLMGLNGEAGECIDILKKHLFQGHKLDLDDLIEELGDVAWYLAISAEAIGVDLETIFKANIEKLSKRYPDGFSEKRSVDRDMINNKIERYLYKKMEMLHHDFAIILSTADVDNLKKCKNTIQIDNMAHSILKKFFGVE